MDGVDAAGRPVTPDYGRESLSVPYQDAGRFMLGQGCHAPAARKALIKAVRNHVEKWGREPEAVDRFVDRASNLPTDQWLELMRLGVLAAIEAAQRHTEAPAAAATVSDRPHAPAVRAATAKASWVPPASTGSGIAARLAVVAPGYDWALPNGAELLEANVEDLSHAIEHHRCKAAHHVGHVKVLAELKAKMLKTRAGRVGDVFTRQQIEDLRTQHGVTSDA